MNAASNKNIRLQTNVKRMKTGLVFVCLFVLFLVLLSGFFLYGLISVGWKGWTLSAPALFFLILAYALARAIPGTVRKIGVPETLLLTPDQFHFVGDSKEICAPWSEVGTPEKRAVGKTLEWYVAVGGQSFCLQGGYWGVTDDTLVGLVNAARAGQFVTLDQWLIDHPEPDERRNLLVGCGIGFAAFCILLIVLVIGRH